MVNTGIILQIKRSVKKGVTEIIDQPVGLIKDFGIEKDAHGKKGKRQLSLMTKRNAESLAQVRDQGLCTQRFNENILISDVDKDLLRPGVRICFKTAQIEITEIGKTCFGCDLSDTHQFCPLVDDVIFAEVCEEGIIKVGDIFEINI
jgi:MOSC domain-containing protein YiiM